MARKKRKLTPPPPRRPAGRDAWLLPGLGGLALVAAWLAALGGLADRTLDLRFLFQLDSLRPWLVFRDAFLTEDYPAQGWRHGVAPFYFPDFAVLWGLFAAGLDVREGMLFYALLQPALAAGGWILVCDRLFGKSPGRRAAVLLLQALALLVAAWRGGDLFVAPLMFGMRGGSWALLPWLLWLLLRTLDAGGAKAGPFHPQKLAAAGALLAGLVLAAASDLVYASWLLAPSAAALLGLVALKKCGRGEFALLAAPLVLCVPLGRALHRSFGFRENPGVEGLTSFNPESMGAALSDLSAAFAYGAARNPAEALAWIFFAVAATWLGLSVLRLAPFPARFFAPPESRAGIFVALFVPLSAGAALGAVVAAGNTAAPPRVFEIGFNSALRYVLPAVYFPLFAGWALLPWRAGLFRLRPLPAACACFAAVVLLAAPKALAVRAAALEPFGTPFHQCFNAAAGRLGWRGGISQVGLAHQLIASPGNDVEKMAAVEVLRRGAGRSQIQIHPAVSNRHYSGGDFQFVVANLMNDRLFEIFFPRGPEERGCSLSGGECKFYFGTGPALDDASIRGAFGDPAEVVECAGLGLYHYDPPIRLDFSATDDPDSAQVGRIF